MVSGEISVSSPPAAMSASVARTPGPPALVRMVRRGPLGRGCLARTSDDVEELADGVDAQDAGALEGRVEDIVAAGERAGVGGGGLGGGGGAAGLDDEDRLAQGDGARGGEEAARVADGFHVDDDGVGVGVLAVVVDEFAEADVEHGAGGDEAAEADALADAPVENGGAAARHSD